MKSRKTTDKQKEPQMTQIYNKNKRGNPVSPPPNSRRRAHSPPKTKVLFLIVTISAIFVFLKTLLPSPSSPPINQQPQRINNPAVPKKSSPPPPLPPKKKRPITQIALLGEHNSGTTWTLSILQQCFSNSLNIKNRLTRHKHWFQYDDGKKTHNNTLVVSQFRNPYHWIAAMMEKPRRSPAHRNMDWKTFLTTPWTTDRAPSDEPFKNETGRVCKENFRYDDIVSCATEPKEGEYVWSFRTAARTPWYEMRPDGSGVPYGSILDLRRDKILNHVEEVKTFPFVEDVIVVRYEQLVKEGTAYFLKEIEEKTGVKAHCEATEGQNRTQRVVEDAMVAYMNKYVDWEVEKLIGYEKW